MNRGGQLLSIREQGVSSLMPPDVPCRDLTFRFIADPPTDGFSAWDTGDDHFDVDEACRPLQGGFALQALNRPFAVALMQRPAAAVVVQGVAGCLVDLPRIGKILQVPVVWLVDQALPAPAELEAPGRTWLANALSDSARVVPTSAEAEQSLQRCAMPRS